MGDYESVKFKIFDVIAFSSRTIIKAYLKRMSEVENVSIDKVVDDFNEYTMYMNDISILDFIGDDEND